MQNTQNTNLNEVKNLNAIITAKENEITNLKYTNDKSQALQAQKIEFLDKEITNLKNNSSQNNELLKDKEIKIKMDEEKLLNRQRRCAEEENKLKDIEKRLLQKEKELDEKKKELHEDHIGNTEKLKESEKRLKSKENQLLDDESKLKEKSMRFNETEMRLKEKDDRIKEKEERIKEKEERLTDKEEKLKSKEDSIRELTNKSMTKDDDTKNNNTLMENIAQTLKEHINTLIPTKSLSDNNLNDKINSEKMNEILFNIKKTNELNEANLVRKLTQFLLLLSYLYLLYYRIKQLKHLN